MRFLNKKIISIGLIVFFLSLFNLPIFVSLAAGNYQLLEPSVIIDAPAGTGETQPANYGLTEYLQTAYIMLFVLIVSAAIFFLILGGLEYILSDLPAVKIEGKSKLIKALTGLAIALSSYLLLQLINPDLLKINLNLVSVWLKKSLLLF